MRAIFCREPVRSKVNGSLGGVESEHEARRNGHHERHELRRIRLATGQEPPVCSESLISRTRKAGPAAVAFVIGLAALDGSGFRDRPGPRHPALLHGLLAECPARPQALGRLHAGSLLPAAGQGPRRSARPDPGSGRRHAGAPRAGPGDRHGPQASPAHQEVPASRHVHDPRDRSRPARARPAGAGRNPRSRPAAVLTARQDRIIELWMRGWSVPEIGAELKMAVTRVSDEKYKALRKLEHQLSQSPRRAGIRATRCSRSSTARLSQLLILVRPLGYRA